MTTECPAAIENKKEYKGMTLKNWVWPQLVSSLLSAGMAEDQSLRTPTHYFWQTFSKCNGLVAKILLNSFSCLGFIFLLNLFWRYTKKLSSLQLEVL